MLCARNADGVSRAINDLSKETAGNHFGAAADLMEGEATRAFVHDAIDALGELDILIHNASGFDFKGSRIGLFRTKCYGIELG